MIGSSHRRLNPLTGEWVLVSPHRTERPWLGQTEKASAPTAPQYDPNCYLCPGNARVGGTKNPQYEHTFVFDNDYPALLGEASGTETDASGLMVAEAEPGICRVICYSPRHDLRLPRMEVTDIARVIAVFADQTRVLGAMPDINSVQIFENHGAAMGASNPHPHCQIWAGRSLPNEVAKEHEHQGAYYEANQRTILADYLAAERKSGERIVLANEHFTVLVPYWAIWPFETMIIPHRDITSTGDLDADEQSGLAAALRDITIRYDNLFETPFPYSMGFHQCPTDGAAHPEWTLHAHFYPPLLRSATIKKFMVGFELLGSPQRDITPEQAAERLRAQPETHYLDR